MPEVIYYPVVDGDDVQWNAAYFYTGVYPNFALGYDQGGYPGKAYVRFPGIAIPQGATIQSAVLTFVGHASPPDTDCRVRMYANDAYTSVAPTSVATGNALVLTSAYVDYILPTTVDGNPWNMPDLKTVVQEIVNRGDWASGNAIGFIIAENGGSNQVRYTYSHDDGNASYYPKLTINYSTGDNPTINSSFNLAYIIGMQGTVISGALGNTNASLPISFSMSGTIVVVPHSVLDALLPISLSVSGTIFAPQYYDSIAYISFPAFTLEAEGSPGYSGISYLNFPAFSLDAKGYSSNFGNGVCEFSPFSLEATCNVSILGTALINMPLFTLEIESYHSVEGNLAIMFPAFSLNAIALAGVIGSFDKNMPPFTLSATGLLDNYGNASISFPVFLLSTSSLASAGYLSMVLNIKNRALTLYENYDFNSMCRFNGKHFGATKTGIYDIDTGTTDDGVLIDWNIKTGYIDLEQKFKKKLRQAWLSYKSDGDLILTVIQANGEEYEYAREGIEITETGLRVKFGKGIRGKYVALDIRNVDGSSITLDVLKLHLEKLAKTR